MNPYPEGWPKELEEPIGREAVDGWVVVPFADAERLREALEKIRSQFPDSPLQRDCDAALNPERGE